MTIRRDGRIRSRAALLCGAITLLAGAVMAQPEQNDKPRPVRNDVARPRGTEFLVLRHQKLKKGSHDEFHRISREGVWPWFEKIGTRVVGQWKVIHPGGEGGSDEYDEGWRLARYASFEHWADTRQGRSIGGNGPDSDKNQAALRERRQLSLGSDGAYYLEGVMAPGGPFYMPGLEEYYELAGSADPAPAAGAPLPVRSDVMRPGQEIVAMRTWKIKKGAFDEFNRASVEGVWPFFEKIGARIIGQWKVVYPEPSDRVESDDYDEVVMMTRYASFEHWQATRRMAEIGGNGPDYDKLREALALRQSLSSETSVTYLQGDMYHSPPKYLPTLQEQYRRIEP